MKMATAIYTMKPTEIAAIVPRGIDFFGSYKSPDMAIPAVKPVTAGKKTAKIVIMETPSGGPNKGTSAGANSQVPAKMETSEIIIAVMMKYCVLMATEVLIMAMAAKVARATDPEILSEVIDISKFKYALKLSAKPTKYNAILKAVATQRVIPMVPPIG